MRIAEGQAFRYSRIQRRLVGRADIGWSNRLGCYEGFRLFVAVNPVGVVTGFRAASATDQQAAETFFAVRHGPEPALVASVGHASWGPYVTEAKPGFEGAENHERWLDPYGVRVIYSPKRNSRNPWPKRLRQWLAGMRQIVETVYDKLINTFALHRERPHDMAG